MPYLRIAAALSWTALALPARECPLERPAVTPDPVAAVEAALNDYLRGFYDAEPERLERCLDRKLTKTGFWRDPESGTWQEFPMSYDQALALAARWNSDGKRTPEGSVGRVEVYEVADDIAAGRIDAVWGTDYAQLVRGDDGQWRIRHILWQSWDDEPGAWPAAEAAVETAVVRAAQDYADGYYFTDPKFTDRGVSKQLVKYGFPFRDGKRMAKAMDFNGLRALCEHGYRGETSPDELPKIVEVLDRRGRTAFVKLTGTWGFDYMAASLEDGAWKIRQVVWQSPARGDVARPALTLADCSNEACPFSGKPVTADSLTRRRGKVYGFCNPHCRDKFARTPEHFLTRSVSGSGEGREARDGK